MESADNLIKSKDRIGWIDIARGIGIFLVVFGHRVAGYTGLMARMIYGVHLPIFFIISGYIYDENKYNNMNWSQFLKTMARKYLIPFYVFSVINFVLRLPLYHRGLSDNRGIELQQEQIKLIKQILWGDSWTGAWFLTCIFFSYIYLWLLKKCVDNYRDEIIVAVVLVVIARILYLLKFDYPFNMDIALYGCVFMLTGSYLRKANAVDRISIKELACVALIGVFSVYTNNEILGIHGGVVGNVVLMYIGATACSLTIFAVVAKLDSKYHKGFRWLKFCGKNSIIFMGMDLIVGLYVPYLWKRLPGIEAGDMNPYISFIMVMLICSIIAYFYTGIKNSRMERNAKKN